MIPDGQQQILDWQVTISISLLISHEIQGSSREWAAVFAYLDPTFAIQFVNISWYIQCTVFNQCIAHQPHSGITVGFNWQNDFQQAGKRASVWYTLPSTLQDTIACLCNCYTTVTQQICYMCRFCDWILESVMYATYVCFLSLCGQMVISFLQASGSVQCGAGACQRGSYSTSIYLSPSVLLLKNAPTFPHSFPVSFCSSF